MQKSIILLIGTMLISTSMFWSCKSLKPVQEISNNNEEEQPFQSLEDQPQMISYTDLKPDNRVKKGMLPNGLTYYIMPNSKPEGRAELRLVVKAGSIDEDHDQLGVAHFVEHMAFNGTEHFAKNELVDYLESVGTEFGPDLNAYTSFEETVYMLQVKTEEESLKKGILVLSDWAFNMSFDQEEIDKERGVVISEWRDRLNAMQRMQQEYLPILLSGSRYSKRLPIGDPEVIKNADYNTIKKFYYDWYRPELMAVVVVGDVTPALVEDYIVEHFADAPKPIAPRKKRTFNAGTHDETLVKVCTDPEAAITQIRIINKLPASQLKTADDFKQRLISSLFTQMMNARLAEKTQSSSPPFLYASCHHGPDIGPMDTYGSFAAAAEGRSNEALKALIEENERVKQHGFTEGELERAKAVILKMAENKLLEKDKTESSRHARRLAQNFLTEVIYLSPEHYKSIVDKTIPAISLDQVNDRIEWFQDVNRVVIITAPEQTTTSLPNKDEVRALFTEVAKSKLEAYEENVSESPLTDLEDPWVELVSKEENETLGTTTYRLKNGATVVMKSTDYSNDEIAFRAVAKGGQVAFPDDDYINVSHASWVVRESGLGEFSNIDLEKKLAGKKVSIRPIIGSDTHGLVGSSGVKEAELLGQLIYLYFTDLRKDSTTFNTFKERMTSYYANILSDPSYYFSNEVARIISKGNVRMMIPSSEELSKLEMSGVYDVFEKIMTNPSEFHFIFSGNINEETKDVLLGYISQIPSGQTSLKEDFFEMELPESEEYVWQKGEAPKSYVETRYFHRVDNLDEGFKEQLGLLKSVLEIKLREQLREEDGGVYGVRTFVSTQLTPDQSYVLGYGFTADPDRREELQKSAQKVLEDLAENGPDDEDVFKVKEIERSKFEKQLQNNQFWVRGLGDVLLEEVDPNRLTTIGLEEKLSQFDAQTMKNMVKGLLEDSVKVTFIQNPE